MKLLTANANTANITTDYWQVIAADNAAGALNDLTKFSVGTITDDSGGVHYANAEDITKFFLGNSTSVGQVVGGKTEGFGTLSLPTDQGQIYGDNFIYVEDVTHFESGDSLVVLEGLKAGQSPYSAGATSPDGFPSEFSTVGVVGLVPTMSTDLFEGLKTAANFDSALLIPSNTFTNTPSAILATVLRKNSQFIPDGGSNFYTPMGNPPTPNNVGAPSGSDPMYVACSGDPQALINMQKIFPDFTAVSFTGTLTPNSAIITNVSSADGLQVGQLLTGIGIPLGTHIAALNTTNIEMTQSATVAADSLLSPVTASGGQITDVFIGADYTLVTLSNTGDAALLGFSPGKTVTIVIYIPSSTAYAPVGWYCGVITSVSGNVITTDLKATDAFLYRLPASSPLDMYAFTADGATGEFDSTGLFQQGAGGNVFSPSSFMKGFPLGSMPFGIGDTNVPTFTFTGTVSAGSNVITGVSSLAGLKVYQSINGTGLAAAQYWITSMDAIANTVTLNQPAVGSGTGTLTAYTSVAYADDKYVYLTNNVTSDETRTFPFRFAAVTGTAFANALAPESLEVKTSGGNTFVATPYMAPYLYSDGVNNPSNGAFIIVPFIIHAYDGSVATVTSINANLFSGNYVTDGGGYYGANPRIINAKNYASLIGETNPPIADANDPTIFGPIANVAVQAQGGINSTASAASSASFLGLDQVYSGIQVGMSVVGNGIANGTVVTSVAGNTIGISIPTTTALTNSAVQFGDPTVLLPSVLGGAAALASAAASIVPGMSVKDSKGYVQPLTVVGSPPFKNPPFQFTGTYTATAANFHTETTVENWYLNADGSFASIVTTGSFTNAASTLGGNQFTFTGSVTDGSNTITVTSNIANLVANTTQAGVIGWVITSQDVILTTSISGGNTYVGALVYIDPTDGTITMVDSTGASIPWATANGGPTSGVFLLTHQIQLMGIIPYAGYFRVLTPVMGARAGTPTPVTTTSEILPTVGAGGFVLAPQDGAQAPVTFTATYQAGVANMATATQPSGIAVGDVVTDSLGHFQSGTAINAITVQGAGYLITLSKAPLGPINLFRVKFAANAVLSISTLTGTLSPVPTVGEIVSDVNLNNCITNVYPASTNASNPAGYILGPPGSGIEINAVTAVMNGSVIAHYELYCTSLLGTVLTTGAEQGTNYYAYTYGTTIYTATITDTPSSPGLSLPGASNNPGDTFVTVTSSGLTTTQVENYFIEAGNVTNQVDAIMYPAFNNSLQTGSWYTTTEQLPWGGFGGLLTAGIKAPIANVLTNFYEPGTFFPAQTVFGVSSTTGISAGVQIAVGTDLFIVQAVFGSTIICTQSVNELNAPVAAGATTLTVGSIGAIVVGSNVILGYAGLSEVLNVASIAGTTLTFSSPIVHNYPTATGPNGTTYNAVLYGGFSSQEYPIGTTVTVGTGIPGDTLIAISSNVISANHIFYPGLAITITPEGIIPTPPTGQNAGSESVIVKDVLSTTNVIGDLNTTHPNIMYNCTVIQGAFAGQTLASARLTPNKVIISHVDPVGTDAGSIGPTIHFTGGVVNLNATQISLPVTDPNSGDVIIQLESGCLHYHARNEQINLPLVYGGPRDPLGKYLNGVGWVDDGNIFGLAGAAVKSIVPAQNYTKTTYEGITDPTSGGLVAESSVMLNKALTNSMGGPSTPSRKVGVWAYLSNGQYVHGLVYGPGVTYNVKGSAAGGTVPAGQTLFICSWYDSKWDGDVTAADGYNATHIVTGGGVSAGATITNVVLTPTSPDTTIGDLVAGYIVTGMGTTSTGKVLTLPTIPAVFVSSTTPSPLTSGGTITLTSAGTMPIGTFTTTFTAVSPAFGINISLPVVLPAGLQGNWPTIATFSTFATNIDTTNNIILLSNTVLNGKITPRSFLADSLLNNALLSATTAPAEIPTPLVTGAAIAGLGIPASDKVALVSGTNITLSAAALAAVTGGVLSLGDPEAFRSQTSPTITVDDATAFLQLVEQGITTFVYESLIFSVSLGSFDGDNVTITTTTNAYLPPVISGDYAPNFPKAGVYVWENTISDDSALDYWTTSVRIPPTPGVITVALPFSYSHSAGTVVASYKSGGRYFGSTTVGDLEFVVPTQVGSQYGSVLDVGVSANSSGALVVSPLPITVHHTGTAVDGTTMTYQTVADLDLMESGGIVIVGMGTTQEAVLLSGTHSRVDGKTSSTDNWYSDVPVTWDLAPGQAFAHNHEPGEPVFLPNIVADIFTASSALGPTGSASTYLTSNVIAAAEILPVASTNTMYIGANLYILDGPNSEFVQINTAWTGLDNIPLVTGLVNSHSGIAYPSEITSNTGFLYAGPYSFTAVSTGLSADLTGIADTTGLVVGMPVTVMVGDNTIGYSGFTHFIASTTPSTITLTTVMAVGQTGTFHCIAGTPDNWSVGQTLTNAAGITGGLRIVSITENQVFLSGQTLAIGGGTHLLTSDTTAFPTVITGYNALTVPTNITDLSTFPIGAVVTTVGKTTIPIGTTIDAVSLQPHQVILNLSSPAAIQTPTFAIGAGFANAHPAGSPILGSAEILDNTPSLVATNTSGTDAINATALVGMTTPWYEPGTAGTASIDTKLATPHAAGTSVVTVTGNEGFDVAYPSVYQYNTLCLPEIGRVIGEIANGRITIPYAPTGDTPKTFPFFIKMAADGYKVNALSSDGGGNRILVLDTPTQVIYPDMTVIHASAFDTASTYTRIDAPHFYLSGVNFNCQAASGVSVIGVSRVSGLSVGMSVTGIGVPAGTFIGSVLTGNSTIYLVDVNSNPVLTNAPINGTPLTFGGADIAVGESIGQPNGIFDPTTNGNLFTSPISFTIPAGSTITLAYSGYTQVVTSALDALPGDTTVQIVPQKANYAFLGAVGVNGIFSTQGTSCHVNLAKQLAKGDVLFLSENGSIQKITVAENTPINTEYIVVDEFIPNYPYDDNVGLNLTPPTTVTTPGTPGSGASGLGTYFAFYGGMNPNSPVISLNDVNGYALWLQQVGDKDLGLAITTGSGAFPTNPTVVKNIKTAQTSVELATPLAIGATSVPTDFSTLSSGASAIYNVTQGSPDVSWVSGDPSPFVVGLPITGYGIPAGTTIVTSNALSLVLSNPATANGAGCGGAAMLTVTYYSLSDSGVYPGPLGHWRSLGNSTPGLPAFSQLNIAGTTIGPDGNLWMIADTTIDQTGTTGNWTYAIRVTPSLATTIFTISSTQSLAGNGDFTGVTTDGTYIWGLLNLNAIRIDMNGNHAIYPLTTQAGNGAAFDGKYLWGGSSFGDGLVRFDPVTLTETFYAASPSTVHFSTYQLEYFDGFLWLANNRADAFAPTFHVYKIDPASPTAYTDIYNWDLAGSDQLFGVTYDGINMWVGYSNADGVWVNTFLPATPGTNLTYLLGPGYTAGTL